VAAQVEILKLGASMGLALEQTSALTTKNEQLRGTVAALSDDQRIERLAGGMGMVLPPPGAVGYLVAGPGGNVAGALGNIHTPDAAAFVAMAAKNGALVTGPGTSTLPPAPGAPAPPPAASTSTTASTTTASTTTASTSTTASTTAATSTAGPTPTAGGSTTGATTSAPVQTATTISQSTPPASQSTAPTQQAPAQQAQATSSSTGSPPTGAAAIQPTQTTLTPGG
jgi:hypothetical protein